MRLFVALEIPPTVRKNLSALQRSVQDKLPVTGTDLRWVRPENFHIALKFIGEASAQELPGVLEALRVVRPEGVVKANCRGLGCSYNARHGGVLWSTMRVSAAMNMLAAQINRRLEHLGFPADQREFLPHLTLARFKHEASLPLVRAVVEENAGREFGSLQPEGFHLIASKLGPGGSQYTDVASFRFAKAANA